MQRKWTKDELEAKSSSMVFSGLWLRFGKPCRILFRQWLVAVAESMQSVSSCENTKSEDWWHCRSYTEGRQEGWESDSRVNLTVAYWLEGRGSIQRSWFFKQKGQVFMTMQQVQLWHIEQIWFLCLKRLNISYFLLKRWWKFWISLSSCLRRRGSGGEDF